MRIISPFKDYYDCVQSQGQDLSLIYNRQPEEIISKTRVFSFVSLLNRWGSDIVSRVEVVGFCGHVHPVLKIHKPGDARVKPVLCYLIEEVDAFVEQHFKPLEIERYYADKRRSYWSERWTYTPHKALVAFFAEARQRAGDFVYLFDKAPVFRCREGRETTLTYNACLKEVEFYRQVDPFTAYQEIQMFWGGRAAPEKPSPRSTIRRWPPLRASTSSVSERTRNEHRHPDLLWQVWRPVLAGGHTTASGRRTACALSATR